jgi:hypothetical protein
VCTFKLVSRLESLNRQPVDGRHSKVLQNKFFRKINEPKRNELNEQLILYNGKRSDFCRSPGVVRLQREHNECKQNFGGETTRNTRK